MSFKTLLLVLLLSLYHSATFAAYTYESCNSLDSKQLHARLEKVIEERIIANQLQNNKIETFILQQWRELGFDATIAQETDNAIQTIKNTTDYWKRYGSSWGTDAADEFAKKVSEEVFGAEVFKNKIIKLTENYLEHTQGNLDKALQQAGEDGIKCLQDFVEHKYGKAFSVNFDKSLNKGIRLSKSNYLDSQEFGGASGHKTAAAGIVTALVGRQIAKALAQKVAQRIAMGVATRVLGSVVTRAIPFVGWAVTAYDFVKGADGALPEIANTLKSLETRKMITDELVKTLKEDLTDKKVIADIAERIYSEWQKFKENYQQVITLADISDPFRATLNEVQITEIEKFSTMTITLLRVFGQEDTIKLANAGDIRKLMKMPEKTTELLSVTKSVDTTFKWYELADSQDARFSRLIELEIFKYKQTPDLTKQQLSQLLLLNDKKIVAALAVLKLTEFEAMLALPQEKLEFLSRQFEKTELETVAWYVRQLSGDTEARSHFVDVIMKHGNTILAFQPDAAKQQIMNATQRINRIDEVAGLNVSWMNWSKLTSSFDVTSWIHWAIIVAGLFALYLFYKIVSLFLKFRQLALENKQAKLPKRQA